MSDSPVNLSTSGPPETVLLPEDPSVVAALEAALELEPASRRDAVAAVVAATPTFLAGWAVLGDLGRDEIESYAYYRVGYHRGLDRMRASGWRGTGYLRAAHEANRGFLSALEGLARTAELIGESDEAERCRHFLVQLDPDSYTI